MRYPTNYISITQGYHQGKSLDFGWCSHRYQDIMSVDDGLVIKAETQITGGNCIYIQHSNGIVSLYGHLDKMVIKTGDKVKLGQKIGTMGQTGTLAKAMHLHFGLYSKAKAEKGFNKNGLYGNADIDPFTYLYVYPNQDASKIALAYKDKIQYYRKGEEWSTGKYQLKYAKYVRKSPKVAGNRYKVKELMAKGEDWNAEELKMLVSKNKNDYAKINANQILQIVKIVKENSNIWGKYGNYGNDYVCLCDITGAQAKKIN